MVSEKRNYVPNMEYNFVVNNNISPKNENRTYSLHFHPEYEFIYVFDGEMDLLVEKEIYHLSAGDVFAVSSMKPHYTIKKNPVSYMYIIVPITTHIISYSPELYRFFSDSQLPSTEFRNLLKQNEYDYSTVIDIFNQLKSENYNKHFCYEYISVALIRQLLSIYVRTVNTDISSQASINFRGLDLILTYIDNNLSNKINLKDLCKLTNYSYNYLSNLFSKSMNISLSDYITSRRIRLAKSLLISTNQSVTDIADKCGFSNSNDIYKKFSAHVGISPLQYRKQYSLFTSEKSK